jgi:hypothetical protein
VLRRDAGTLAAAMDTFCDDLLQAAIAKGTIRKVAEALEVEAAQIFRWLGGLDPADQEPAQIAARLKQLGLFEAYFDRRNEALAAWQR